jgi:putative DNA methylase
VLRDEGLLVFSYHHSREDGWAAVAHAVLGAGFSFVQCQPVKAEMSVAMPKMQAKEPIDLDVLLVCRKRHADRRSRRKDEDSLHQALVGAGEKASRFNSVGRRLSRNDVRVVLLSQLLVELSPGRTADEVAAVLQTLLPKTRSIVEKVWEKQDIHPASGRLVYQASSSQLGLFAMSATHGKEA